MTCNNYVDLIARKLEGSLSAKELEALKSHLSACPGCRAELLLQQSIASSLAQPPGSTLPADFAERVSRQAFRQAQAERRARRWGYLVPVAANAVVVALAILYRVDIAAVLGPFFAALGEAAGTVVHLAGSGFAGVPGPAWAVGPSATYMLGMWGPLLGASAVIILASSRIYALRRR